MDRHEEINREEVRKETSEFIEKMIAAQQGAKPLSIKLSGWEHAKIVGFLIFHTIVVVGSLLCGMWSYTSGIERRLMALEMHRDADVALLSEIRADFKIIAVHVTEMRARMDRDAK